jgi:hypothetical protein
MRFNGGHESREFMHHIRQYNCLFNFTSFGAQIDKKINDGKGPYVFRVSGQLSHKIGTLKPHDGKPKFAQLYIHDTDREIENRIKALCKDDDEDDIDGELDLSIVLVLKDMLDCVNPLVKKFRQARDRLKDFPNKRLAIRILAPQKAGDV